MTDRAARARNRRFACLRRRDNFGDAGEGSHACLRVRSAGDRRAIGALYPGPAHVAISAQIRPSWPMRATRLLPPLSLRDVLPTGRGDAPAGTRVSLLKQLVQPLQCRSESTALHRAQPPDQPLLIECPNLIEQDQTAPLLESDRNAKWRRPTASCHRRSQDGPQMVVQFGRRDDDARPRFLDLTADRGIKNH